MKKTKGERLNWQKESELKPIKINFKKLSGKKIKAIRRPNYNYLIE